MPAPTSTLTALLLSLAPLGVFVGVGLILPGRDGFLYGGRPLRSTPTGSVLELTSIGGGLEPGDASLTAAVHREAVEEIGCDVRLLPSPETVVVRRPGRAEVVTLAGGDQPGGARPGGDRPAAVVCRGYRTPPHSPWHPQHQGETCIVIYLAELLGCPQPSPEIPFLTWLDAGLICALARTDRPFASLAGAWMVLAPVDYPPADAPVRLTDSQEALILALGAGALPFYRGIADRFS